jgi:hypothetical protein
MQAKDMAAIRRVNFLRKLAAHPPAALSTVLARLRADGLALISGQDPPG